MSDLSVSVLDDRTLLGTYFCDDAPSVTMHLGVDRDCWPRGSVHYRLVRPKLAQGGCNHPCRP